MFSSFPLSPAAKARASCIGDVDLLVWLFVSLSVASAAERPQRCHRCLLLREKLPQGLPSLYMVGLACAQWKIGGKLLFIYREALCPECFLMAAGGSGGIGSFRKGRGNEPDFGSRLGVEAIAPPVNFCLQWGLIRGTILVVLSFLIVKFRCTPIFRNRVVSSCDVQLQSTCT